jgi:peptidoglycan hydrolase-like protein with peptidoglycan-binding domain
VSRRALGLAGAGAAVALAAALAFLAFHGDGNAKAASTEAPTGTAVVDRRDLVLRVDVDGTLGYADSRPLQAGSGGTVTRLPLEGAVIHRGESLYAVDGRGVRLLYGTIPLWRRLAAGVDDGPDVLQLERNLVALGHDPDSMAVDDQFDADTAAAVRDWQKAIGVPQTGGVDPGQAVFLPGARRVGTISASVGAALQPGQEVMQTTSTAPVVSIDLDATKRAMARTGAAVAVELPSGRVVHGRIASVGKVAETETSQQGEQSTPTVPVTVTLLQPSGEDLEGAPVTVSIEQDRASNVLAVPVEALLALRGGGFGVELVGADGTRTLTGVDTGTFADGWVEVRGRGIRAGAKVVVPA